MSTERYFTSDSNSLASVCTMPSENMPKAGVIFVHAAGGNRLGPHRMFVEIAYLLKEHSIASLRFDMRGCGDSTGEPAGRDIAPDIEDLRDAVNYFAAEHQVPRIFLFGISRGSRVIFSALSKEQLPIAGACLLSTPFPDHKSSARKFTSRLMEYLCKCTDSAHLKKLFTGKVHIQYISQTLAESMRSSGTRKYLKTFATVCPLFFIYAQKDPIAAASMQHYQKLCDNLEVPCRFQQIENANHSFFHYKWKEQIMERTLNWLLKEIENGGNNARYLKQDQFDV